MGGHSSQRAFQVAEILYSPTAPRFRHRMARVANNSKSLLSLEKGVSVYRLSLVPQKPRKSPKSKLRAGIQYCM